MREIALALGIAALLGGFAVALTAPPELVMIAGRNVMLLGGVVGTPIEVVYFGLLAWTLSRRSALPRGWYWRTFDHHWLLVGRERWVVLPWFYAGAFAFVVCVLGIVASALGLVGTLARL